MSSIVDLQHRQVVAANASAIEADEPSPAPAPRSGAASADGAEIILFPRLKRRTPKPSRKKLTRRFALRT